MKWCGAGNCLSWADYEVGLKLGLGLFGYRSVQTQQSVGTSFSPRYEEIQL